MQRIFERMHIRRALRGSLVTLVTLLLERVRYRRTKKRARLLLLGEPSASQSTFPCCANR
jgi:hypothetical protein